MMGSDRNRSDAGTRSTLSKLTVLVVAAAGIDRKTGSTNTIRVLTVED